MYTGVSESANGYVQMKALEVVPYGDGVDNGTVAQLMQMGYENFGATFNFTVGRETAEHFLFVCGCRLTEVWTISTSMLGIINLQIVYSTEDEE